MENLGSERVNGTDLYYKILGLAEKHGYKIFFLAELKNISSLEARLNIKS